MIGLLFELHTVNVQCSRNTDQCMYMCIVNSILIDALCILYSTLYTVVYSEVAIFNLTKLPLLKMKAPRVLMPQWMCQATLLAIVIQYTQIYMYHNVITVICCMQAIYADF